MGKKYQWIALYEFLGLLSDHYHLESCFGRETIVFKSATDLDPIDLLDPFKPWELTTLRERNWEFVPKSNP